MLVAADRERLALESPDTITLGEHFGSFVHTRVQAGRYASAREVVRAGLRLLESEAEVRQTHANPDLPHQRRFTPAVQNHAGRGRPAISGPAGSHAMLPVVRHTVEVHHCQDEDAVGFFALQHAVRKTLDE